METLTSIVTAINDFVWGPPMLVLILGTGLLLQLRLKFMPILRIGTGFKMVWKGRHPPAGAAGDISPYAALMTALGLGATLGILTWIFVDGHGAGTGSRARARGRAPGRRLRSRGTPSRSAARGPCSGCG